MLALGRSGTIGKLSGLVAGVALAVCSLGAQAALWLRDIDGSPVSNAAGATFVYDDDLNLTWLRDWNYAKTSGFDADGRMSWPTAMNWAGNLTVGTFSGWRLPTANTGPNSNCRWTYGLDPGSGFPQQYYGPDCTGSEMGHLWYTELGNTYYPLTNAGPFINLLSCQYDWEPCYSWSGTAYAPDPTTYAWFFDTLNGAQHAGDLNNPHYAVAVRPGDVCSSFPGGGNTQGCFPGPLPFPAPEPSTLALLGLGLAGLAFARRRKQ